MEKIQTMKNLNEECIGFVNKMGHVYHYVFLDKKGLSKAKDKAEEIEDKGDIKC